MGTPPSADAPPGAARLPFTVAFLIGHDNATTRLAIEAVCAVPGVRPALVLVDVERPTWQRRARNLRGNLRREGPGYLWFRAVRALRDRLDAMAERMVPAGEVDELLRKSFPERSFSLQDLATRYGFDLVEVVNLNSSEAAETLRTARPDLGIILGTRILKASTFTVPALGSINLHEGKVPEYRGLPPGFWELYEGAATAGVTVHFVDAGMDTGDVVTAGDILIHPKETPGSLRTKLEHEGARLLAEAVAQVSAGSARRRPQPPSTRKPRTRPTRCQEQELISRVPHMQTGRNDFARIAKTILHLSLWHSGLHRLLRTRARRPNGRAAIILHHRVNDVSVDPLTTSIRTLAEHLTLLRRYYEVRSTSTIVEGMLRREYIPPRTVAIHFDDCYRDFYTNAAPLFAAAGLPAMAFIATGFIDTDRVFAHDANKYPHRFENLTGPQVTALLESGFDLGPHTVNHVDLGSIGLPQAREEVLGSKHALEALIGRPTTMFSFPFGKPQNISPAALHLIREAGFTAVFSAYGGFVDSQADLWDIPRLGANSNMRALDLMMELEGVSAGQLATRLRRFLKGRRRTTA